MVALFNGYIDLKLISPCVCTADGAHFFVLYLYHTVALTACNISVYRINIPLINVALIVDVMNVVQIVSYTATILFVNVSLGPTGDTHQNIKSSVNI